MVANKDALDAGEDAEMSAASSREEPPKINDVVSALNEIMAAASLDGPERAAQYLINVYYEGDLAKYRSRDGEAPSLREIAEHPQAKWSKRTIYDWLRVYDFRDSTKRDWRLEFTHFREAMNLPDHDARVALLERAEREGWPSRKLKEHVRATKPESKAGRPPDPGFVRAMKAVRKAIEDKASLAGVEGAVTDPKAAKVLAEDIARVREWLAGLEARAGAVESEPTDA